MKTTLPSDYWKNAPGCEEYRTSPPLGGPNGEGPAGNGPGNAANRFELIPVLEFEFLTAVAYLVKGFLPRAGLAIIWGPPKCGKSFWLFDLLMHVALGWKYRGRKVVRGAVVYCVLEGAAGFRNRVEAFRRKHFLTDFGGEIPFYIMKTPLALYRDHLALIASIKEKLGATTPVAVTIDTLNRSIDGSESKDEDMGKFITAAGAIEAAFNCLVPVIHHCGHDGNRPRGFSGLLGANDVQIAVTKSGANDIISVVEWMKDGPEGEKVASRLEPIELGMDDDGDPITSCVVVEGDIVAAEKITPEPKEKSAAATLRDEYLNSYDIVASTGSHVPGHTNARVWKVNADTVRDKLRERGFLGGVLQ